MEDLKHIYSIYSISYPKFLVHVTCLLASPSKLQPVRALTVNLHYLHRRTLTKVNNILQKGVEFNEMDTLVSNSTEQRPS